MQTVLFPFRYSDGTIAEMVVSDGAIQEAILLNGNASLVDDRNKQLKDDPATGIIGELGFGTQLLPFSGKDIQDEKNSRYLPCCNGQKRSPWWESHSGPF